jgi:hypothetical protein
MAKRPSKSIRKNLISQLKQNTERLDFPKYNEKKYVLHRREDFPIQLPLNLLG